MTTAILATSLQEVAVALAVHSSDLLPTTEACILIASTAVVTEFDHHLLDQARAAAETSGVTVVDLGAVIAPRHPLGWRKADLAGEQFAQAWQRLTGLSPITVCAQVGRERNATINSLSKATGARVVNIVTTPEHFGSAVARRRRQTLVVDAPAIATLLTAGRIRAVPAAALRAARGTVATLGATDRAEWRTSYLRWWARLLRSVTRAVVRRLKRTTPTPPAPRIDRAAEQIRQSAEFTGSLIAELDHEHQHAG